MIYPQELNLVVLQGATFYRQITWKTGPVGARVPVDLTGAEIRMQVRYSPQAEQILVDANTENGQIVIEDAVNGVFAIDIPATVTDLLAFPSGVYDLEIEQAGTVHRLLEGRVELVLQVTR